MKFFHKIPIIFILCLLCLLLFSCTSAASLERERQKISNPTDYLESHGIEQYASSVPVVYNNGVEWYARAFELVEQAQDYILINTFLSNLLDLSEPLWDLLAKKIIQGVRVYCLFDSSSYFQLYTDRNEVIPAAFNHLRELGIPVTEYNPFSLSNSFFLPMLLDRDHRKFWIIDGKQLAVGGININHASLGLPPESGHIDSMVEVVSPKAIEVLIGSFIDTWNRYNPDTLDPLDFYIEDTQVPLDVSLWLVDHHWPARSQATTMFDAFTLGAQKELWMVQGFAFMTGALTERIANAVDRGVEVHILLSDNAGKPNYEKAAKYGILDLIDAGATVYMYSNPTTAFLHLKLMIADGYLTAYGSTNYDLRSQTLSREISIIFDDEQIASAAKAHVDELLKYCRIVTREEAVSYRNFVNYCYYLLMQVWG
ncbi:MAG: phosphatidylserine/phosphatidylglycerophosphate/cardiolipin synthase family protein [Sphaerochaetaceae bacterium]|nr:phosphatidylserine/phosphatidylglycerophosphate/cardiolipin synthase family protein [Sphaerochaetaceae bacterium]